MRTAGVGLLACCVVAYMCVLMFGSGSTKSVKEVEGFAKEYASHGAGDTVDMQKENQNEAKPTYFKADPDRLFEEMKYWEYLEEIPPPSEAIQFQFGDTSKERYLTFEVDRGGFNNVRLQFETVLILAHMMNRTLVLPPKQHYYLLKGDRWLEDFYDVSHLKRYMNVISAQEHLRRHDCASVEGEKAIHDIWREMGAEAIPNWKMYDDVLSIPSIAASEKADKSEWYPDYATFVNQRKKVELSKDMLEVETFHVMDKGDVRLFGLWYPFMYFSNPEWHRFYVSMIRSGFHYKDDLYRTATRLISKLVGSHGKYHAIHVRRGEFQYHQTRIPAEEILQHIAPLFGKHNDVKTIYIASDEKDKSFFKPFLESDYTIKFLHDFPEEMNAVEPALLGMLEQLVCTTAEVFVGTELSTMSAHITRLRHHMKHDVAPDKNMYLTTRQYTGNEAEDVVESNGTWMNDGRPGWPHAVYFREWFDFLNV